MNTSAKIVTAVVVSLLFGQGCTSTAQLAREQEKTRQAEARAADAEQRLATILQEKGGVDHSIDWKNKWVKAENWRVEIEQIKNQEIAELNIHIQNLITGIEMLERKNEALLQDNDALASEVLELMNRIEVVETLFERAQIQLNVQIATVQRLQELVDEYRAKEGK